MYLILILKKIAKKTIRLFFPNYRTKFSLYKNSKPYENIRKDIVDIIIQDGVFLEVYWKILEIGKGPAVTLVVYDYEILRFDCFGKEKGHYHIMLREYENKSEQRIYFPEKTVEEQIDRTVFEITGNLYYYIHRNPIRKVRNMKISEDRLWEAARQAKIKMYEYYKNVPELCD